MNGSPQASPTRATSGHLLAFSLIEMLVSIAIVAILAALVVGVVGGLYRNGYLVSDLANLREIATATFLYAQDNDGYLPTMKSSTGSSAWTPPYWPEKIMPYLGSTMNAPPKVLYSPSFKSNHSIAGYGCNLFYIHENGSRPIKLVQIPKPSEKILFANASSERFERLWGMSRAVWYLNNHSFLTSPKTEGSTEPIPWPIHNGKVAAVFGDGRADAIPFETLAANPAKYLGEKIQ